MLKFRLQTLFLFFFLQNIPLYGKDMFLLVPGPHRDLVIQNCLACHSERLILQNNMTRKAWDNKITWMQKTQNLWPLDLKVRSHILDYLETVQGPNNSIINKDPMDGLPPRRANLLMLK
jgi:hypothetical protein